MPRAVNAKYEITYGLINIYKGEKGYMTLVGHMAETGLVIGSEFREGEAAPAVGNLEFLQACKGTVPKGKKIPGMRADSAVYQARSSIIARKPTKSLRSARIWTRR